MFTKRRLKWAKPLDVPQFSRHAQLTGHFDPAIIIAAQHDHSAYSS